MRAQACHSCGARYNVERLAPGSTFACRRCGADVAVGSGEMPVTAFSFGLLLAGTLTLAGLFLYANPSFGAGSQAWPWELLQREGAWADKVALGLWALAGVWALVSSLGIAPRRRSVLTVALAGTLLLVCASGDAADFRIDAARLPLPLLAALAALGAGLALLPTAGRETLARALAFGGGIAIVWHFAFAYTGGAPALEGMIENVRAFFDGSLPANVSLWTDVLPDWALLLSGVVGILVGFGASGRFLATTGLVLVLVGLALPTLADLFDQMGEDRFWENDGWSQVAAAGRDLLIEQALALWLLASYALADLARNRKAPA